jgi:hypothetical protein
MAQAVTRGLSRWKLGFNSRRVRVTSAALGQVLLRVLRFPFSVSYQQCSTVLTYMLLLPEAWERSKKQFSFGNPDALDRKVLSLS